MLAAIVSILLAVGLMSTGQAVAAPNPSIQVPAITSAPADEAGWTTLLEDDFNGAKGSLPDSNTWTEIIGHKYPENGSPDNYGTGEIQSNTADPSNVALDGQGNLVITALRDGPHTDAKAGWTAARVETKQANLKAPAGGIMKAVYRFQLPNRPGAQGLGYWPALWMYPGSLRADRMSWPHGCEFDLVENVQSKLDELWNVVHCKADAGPGKSWGGSFDEPTGIANSGHAQCVPESCQEAMHTGMFIWDRSGTYPVLSWYLDGVKSFEVSPTPEFIATRKAQFADRPELANLQDTLPVDWKTMEEGDGFAFIINIAMGGAFPDSRSYGGGPTDATVAGGKLIVDFVKVSTFAGDGTATPPPAPSTSVAPTPDPTTPVPPTTEPPATTPTPAPPVTDPPVIAPPTTTPQTPSGPSDLVNGASRTYPGIDFGSAPLKALKLHLITAAPPGVSGTIEVHLDSATGPIVGTLSIGNGFETSWTDKALDSTATGLHNVVVTEVSGQPERFGQIDYVLVG